MKFWIDIVNAPHVLFFKPIIETLEQKGHKVYITVRDNVQLLALLELHSICYKKIGRHYGKNIFMKVIGTGIRSFQLYFWALDKKIDVGVALGSTSSALASRLRGIPHITIYDYGYFYTQLLNRCADKIIIPDAIPVEFIVDRGGEIRKIIQFPGTKEEVYCGGAKSFGRSNLLRNLGIDSSKVIVLIRPPAILSYYHDKKSEFLFERLLEIISINKKVVGIVFPRTKLQEKRLNEECYENIYVLKAPVDGLELILNSDLVISGGGTMIREASAVGIPAYSIFTGEKTWVDKKLARQGKIKFVESIKDLDRISFTKRKKKNNHIDIIAKKSKFLINFFIKEIENREK